MNSKKLATIFCIVGMVFVIVSIVVQLSLGGFETSEARKCSEGDVEECDRVTNVEDINKLEKLPLIMFVLLEIATGFIAASMLTYIIGCKEEAELKNE